MFYAKHKRGYYNPITRGNVYARCPRCKGLHKVDLGDILSGPYRDIDNYGLRKIWRPAAPNQPQ